MSAQDAVDPALFGDLMCELPSGVAVVTTRGPQGPIGLAVTSVTSYTAAPPSVLVSIADSSRCYDHLLAGETFGVHVLHAGQQDIARTFASKADDKFAELAWAWDGDVPHIAGALAFLRCATEASFTHRDHTILIGRITSTRWTDDVEPMVYLRRRFAWRLADG